MSRHIVAQAHYDRLRAQGYAGPRAELAQPDAWPTSHWALINDPRHGTCLYAVEVVPR